MINIYNRDCMEYMTICPDKSFDLAIVDPPYGINAGKMTMGSGRHNFERGADWDESIPGADYFAELERVSVNQVIWGGNYFTEFLPPSPHWLLWDKNNPNLSFAEGELAWVRAGNNLRILKHYSATEGPNKIHPTQKPVRLYDWILKLYAQPGQRVLDTHLGSGSSAIAAHYFGVDFVGTELDTGYYNAAIERFDLETKQAPLLF